MRPPEPRRAAAPLRPRPLVLAPLILASMGLPSAALGAPLSTRPADYGGKVLVMLSASLVPGEQPAGLQTAAKLTGQAPVRLSSTMFKGLMPCYEIVVAGAYPDAAAAKAAAAKLKAAGVDVAVKPAGAFVGPRPELAATCAALAKPAPLDEQVAFLDPVGLRLPLPEAVEDAALQGAPAVRSQGGSLSVWSAPLPHRTIGRYAIGQHLAGFNHSQGPVDCVIEGFSVGVVGEPHFGWVEAGAHKTPSCGSPAAHATLRCAGGEAQLIDQRPGARVAIPTAPEAKSRPPDKPLAGHADQLRDAEDHAKAQGLPLQVSWFSRPYTLGGAPVRALRLHLQTGEGEWVCGGEDLNMDLIAVLDAKGAELLALRPIRGSALLGLVQAGPGKPVELHLREEITNSQRLEGGPSSPRLDLAFCDCGC